MGDMFDYSKELSDKRAAQNGGIDPVKKKYFENYSKERNGAKHFEEMKTYENNGHAYHTTMPTDSLVKFEKTVKGKLSKK